MVPPPPTSYGGTVRVLVIGATGTLGRELRRALPAGVARAPGREALELRDPASIDAALAGERPDLVVNVAADNRVDAAEQDPSSAQAINTDAVGHLARAAAAAGAFFVHTSTDYVFDGRARTPYPEDALPSPLRAYARAK